MTFADSDGTPLLPGGADLAVTDSNKHEFIFLKMRRVLLGRIEPQLEALLAGFFEVIPRSLVAPFAHHEIATLIAGESNVDVDDWRRNTRYRSGYSGTDQTIKWFWQIVQEFTPVQRQHLLEFATGSAWVPAGGFAMLQGSNGVTQPFTLVRTVLDDFNVLPKAHTCFNRLDLPSYTSLKYARQQLTLVAEMDMSGIAFGMQ